MLLIDISEWVMLSLLSSFGAGSAVFGRDGRLEMADDAYLAILKWSRDRLGALVRDVITHPSDLGRNLLLLDQQRRDGKPFEIAKRYVQADGQAVWVQNRVSVLHGGHAPRTLVLSRPLPEAEVITGEPDKVGRMAFAGVVSEASASLALHARRLRLIRTAGHLEEVADAAIPEASASS